MIDRRLNKNADIGRFELMYKAAPVQAPSYVGIDLSLDGRAINNGNKAATTNNTNSTTSVKQTSQPQGQTSPRQSISITKSTSPQDINNQLPSLDSTEGSSKVKANKVLLKLRKESTLPAITNLNGNTVMGNQTQNELIEQIKANKRNSNYDNTKGVNATVKALNSMQIGGNMAKVAPYATNNNPPTKGNSNNNNNKIENNSDSCGNSNSQSTILSTKLTHFPYPNFSNNNYNAQQNTQFSFYHKTQVNNNNCSNSNNLTEVKNENSIFYLNTYFLLSNRKKKRLNGVF